MIKKRENRRQVESCFLVFKNNVLPALELDSGRKLSSHTGKTSLLKTEEPFLHGSSVLEVYSYCRKIPSEQGTYFAPTEHS